MLYSFFFLAVPRLYFCYYSINDEFLSNVFWKNVLVIHTLDQKIKTKNFAYVRVKINTSYWKKTHENLRVRLQMTTLTLKTIIFFLNEFCRKLHAAHFEPTNIPRDAHRFNVTFVLVGRYENGRLRIDEPNQIALPFIRRFSSRCLYGRDAVVGIMKSTLNHYESLNNYDVRAVITSIYRAVSVAGRRLFILYIKTGSGTGVDR